MIEDREVNYGELDCRLEGYLNKYESIINTSKEMEDMIDDILKLVNECSYPSGKVEQLQSQLQSKDAEIERLSVELNNIRPSWKDAIFRTKEQDELLNSLTSQIEKLIGCLYPERCPEWESYDKCSGCQNKQLLEE